MPMIIEFKECADCLAKGVATLCASCLHNEKTINEFQAHLRREQEVLATKLRSRKDPKRFRINRLRVHAVAVDSEDSPGMRAAAERAGHEYDEDSWQDLVVTLEDQDGNKFEAARITLPKNGNEGSCTYVAKLVCARSWGVETDDDSVSCPLCFHRGHGAGACTGP